MTRDEHGEHEEHDEHGERRPDVPSDLGAELRRLFADDRLVLPVGRDAETRVIAGARRRRRKRRTLATTGGVLAVAAIVLAGGVLSGLVHPSHPVRSASGPAVLSTTAVTTTAPAVPATQTVSSAVPDDDPDSADVLGPTGVGKLSIGMSWKAVLSSGILRPSGPITSAGCERYTVLVGSLGGRTVAPSPATVPVWDDKAEIVVNVRDDVVQLITGPTLHTPEGIGIGSNREDLREAYPDVILPVRSGTTSVPVDGNPIAVYVFDVNADGTVTSFSLRMIKSDCLG